MKAIVLAGGKGSRFLPLTEKIPKALIPVGDSTLIEIVLDSLPDQIDTVIITIKYLGKTIKDHLGISYKNKKILYAEQPLDMDGTWPAMACAERYVSENELFCVLNCDDLFKKEELEIVLTSKKIGMGITQTVMPAKYHGVVVDTKGFVAEFHRHTDRKREELMEDVFANGLFILDKKVFSLEPYQLTDKEHGLPQTLVKHKKEYPLFAHKIASWHACNTPEDLLKIL